MPAISERVARWVRGLGLVGLIATVITVVVRRWGHSAAISAVEIAGASVGAVVTTYGCAVCSWWRREQRRREREEFERLLSKGASRYS